MLCLRRAALRALSSPPKAVLLASKPRALATFSKVPLRRSTPSTLLHLQRRWASEEAPKAAAEATETPITPDVAESVVAASEAESPAATESEQQLETPSESAAAAEAASNVLYVGNLFFDVTGEDLQREFSKFGDVLQAKIIYDGRGLSKGFAYVTFNTVEQATTAMQNLNQQLFEGRRLAVQYRRERRNANRESGLATPRAPRDPSRTLFIGNMSFEMTDQDLNDLFRDARNVIDVRVAIDRRTGQPRGFAHADFIDVASAEKAKRMLENKEVYGRRLRVDFSHSRRDGPAPGEQSERPAQTE